ncbi:MAG: hypothetical protein E7132_03770 [Rikenellaceae bacterium]|nr:hypothetical protein [Rikenellaceae bacterium]
MKKWLLLAVVGLMSACSKSDIEEVNTSIGAESPIFYASLEGSDETRTYLDENAYMRWTADDRVTIFFGENYNREFAFTGETGSTAGSFNQKSTDGFYTAEKVTANYAVYPHQASTQLEVEGYFKLSLPATQSYAEDSFGLNANTMVAVTKTVDNRFLQFKNVCGYLKLNLYGANVTVKSITLTGNNEEPLAGAATVTPTYGGDPSMAWAASGTTTSLTLDCGDGVKIGATEAEATPFWLVVPPTTFTKGFTVTITDTAGNTFTKSSTSKQTITRNISKNMPAFEVKTAPTGPANNEIWYTSTDGKIVEPDVDAFGVAIKSNTYENGKGVITFDGDVKMIGERAFQDCESLVSITLPEGLTTIGERAFLFCTSLTSITLPEGLTTIGSSAFSGCTSLASITLPEGLTTIGDGAFSFCTSLASVTIPEGVTTIGSEAFRYCTSLTSITIPEGVTTIGRQAFWDCTSLASITLPEGVTTIGAYAFSSCTSLAKFEGPLATSDQRCIVIDGALVAFAPAELFEYVIPEGVTSIGGYAFSGCRSLASITLPEGLTTIGERAFLFCTSLTSVYCKPTTPPAGGSDMFRNNATDRKIYVPAGSVDAYKAAQYWSDYASAIVAEE